MPKAISELNLFPTFATREAYQKATGKPCPAWNPNLPPKSWEDPAALNSQDDFIVYERVFVTMLDSGPKWKRLFLPKAQAASVNIPPKGDGMTNVPGADVPEIPCPQRELRDDEVVKAGFGNVPMLYTSAELEASRPAGQDFTVAEKQRLLSAADKILGV